MKRYLRESVRELKLLRRLRKVAVLAAVGFNLPLPEVFVNETLEDCYGRCFYEGGKIELRFRRSDGRFYSMKVILDTLAHELAHLVESGHNQKHRLLTWSILQAIKGHFERKPWFEKRK